MNCVCIYPGCNKHQTKKAFCNQHYIKFYRAGKFGKHVKHGAAGTDTYIVWAGIMLRIFNVKSASYKKYGGRGISMDIGWFTSFKNFLHDVGPRPGKQFQLDRIDSTRGYFKDNVRWLHYIENCTTRKQPEPF